MTWDPVPVGEWNAAQGQVGYIIHWKRFDMNEDQWQKVNTVLEYCSRAYCVIIM